jgi:hypothetical protein
MCINFLLKNPPEFKNNHVLEYNTSDFTTIFMIYGYI